MVHCQAGQGKEVRVHVKRYVKIDSKNNYTIRSLPGIYTDFKTDICFFIIP